MIAFKNFTRTTFNLVLFLFSQCVTDRDLILGSSFSTINTSYYRGKNKESNKAVRKRHILFTIQKAVKQSLIEDASWEGTEGLQRSPLTDYRAG